MTVTEAVKSAVGLGAPSTCTQLQAKKAVLLVRAIECSKRLMNLAAATREQMSEARLPIQYRDGCAGLLIPLNRCRYEEYYLPWKCEG
ncbi:hypothetical protein B2J93_7315 [Marssonina coronariae]|uniref:NADH dehydrogenase [ubiquinone] 1 beta subcomplex subunit 7 n=1 Tax=Diplocarpon coronariae TaxID=2795749 RepID=A0A218YZU2_9HELO|nr:hypothetical protein B2J93_7315 [Marssonina coronariae]